MIYSLKCGNCLTDNNVSADDEPILWVCNGCGNENSSSLPVTAADNLITDYTKAKSILSPAQAAAATDVVEGEVV